MESPAIPVSTTTPEGNVIVLRKLKEQTEELGQVFVDTTKEATLPTTDSCQIDFYA